jgi:hypothetical protein
MNPEYCQKPELSGFTAKKLASLYAEVFGAPPWNEVWRCPSCNRFYGSKYAQSSLSPCCSVLLTVAYPETETMSYIREEFSKPFAQKRLFYSKEGQLIAFAWGHQIENAAMLAQKKWPQSQKVQDKVIEAITKYANPEPPLYYISEVGVFPPFRGNRIGFQLTQDLLNYGASLGEPVVFRTNWESPMMRIAAHLEMIQIMGPKIKVVDNQIVKTGEIAGFIDEINPDRTLFIKPLSPNH